MRLKNPMSPILVLILAILINLSLVDPIVFSVRVYSSPFFLLSKYLVFNFTKISSEIIDISFHGKYIVKSYIDSTPIPVSLPVPNETDWETVRVFVNGILVDYIRSMVIRLPEGNFTYRTAYGPLPVIEWLVYGRGTYIVDIYYNYIVELDDETGYTVYPLGIGRYSDLCQDLCTIRITVNYFDLNGSIIRIAYLNPENGNKDYIRAYKISGSHISDEFFLLVWPHRLFKDDLVFEFEPSLPPGSSPAIKTFNAVLKLVDPEENQGYTEISLSGIVEPGETRLVKLHVSTKYRCIRIDMTIDSTGTSSRDRIGVRVAAYIPSVLTGPKIWLLQVYVNGDRVFENTIDFSKIYSTYSVKIYKTWTYSETSRRTSESPHQITQHSSTTTISVTNMQTTSRSIEYNTRTTSWEPIKQDNTYILITVIIVLAATSIILFRKQRQPTS